MQVIIVGGDSKLGLALGRRIEAYQEEVSSCVLICTTRRLSSSGSSDGWEHLDLLKPSFPFNITQLGGPVVVYLVAAVTSIIQCEYDLTTWRVNADAPSVLTAIARARGWQVVFVSSDAVERASRTAYGMQKAHAEAVVMGLGGCVVRPARIAPDQYDEVADLLLRVGEHLAGSHTNPWLVRWPEV